MGSLALRGGRIWGLDPKAKHAIVNCFCHLANRNEKRFRVLPNQFAACYFLCFVLLLNEYVVSILMRILDVSCCLVRINNNIVYCLLTK